MARRRGTLRSQLLPGQQLTINGRRRLTSPWQPFQAPSRPPAGKYDPVLDAQLRASKRGLNYLWSDSTLADSRDVEDYGIASADLDRNAGRSRSDMTLGHGRTIEDLTRGRDRSLADIGTGRTRATEDHTTNTETIGRNYRQLGQTQGQAASLSGVSRGGTLAAALMRRTENQGRDQAAEDRGFGRTMADYGTAESRTREDFDTGKGRADVDLFTGMARLGEDVESNRGGLGRTLLRAVGDRATERTRAADEHTFFGQDIGESRFFSAAQAGWKAPTRPANERKGPRGPYRIVRQGRRRVRVNPQGFRY